MDCRGIPVFLRNNYIQLFFHKGITGIQTTKPPIYLMGEKVTLFCKEQFLLLVWIWRKEAMAMHKILCQETPQSFGRLHQKRQFKLLKTWSVFANPDLDVSQNRQPLFFENCYYTVNESSLKIGFIGVRLLMLRLDMVKPSQITVTRHLFPVDYEQIFWLRIEHLPTTVALFI